MDRIYRRGVPVRREVDLLMQLGVEEGKTISYAEVEAVIGVPYPSHRWRTVTTAWRHRVFREHGIRIVAELGAFRMLTPTEALSAGVRDMHAITRAAGRATVRLSAVRSEALSADDRDRLALAQRNAHAMLLAAEQHCAAVSLPRPVTGR